MNFESLFEIAFELGVLIVMHGTFLLLSHEHSFKFLLKAVEEFSKNIIDKNNLVNTIIFIID